MGAPKLSNFHRVNKLSYAVILFLAIPLFLATYPKIFNGNARKSPASSRRAGKEELAVAVASSSKSLLPAVTASQHVPLSSPISTRNRWLVYYTIGGSDVHYINLLRFQLATLRSFPENYAIDVVVLIDSQLRDAAMELFPASVAIVTHDMDPSTCFVRPLRSCPGILASMRKTRVFDLVPGIANYEGVLFLDVDIVITAPLAPVFHKIAEIRNKLHVVVENQDEKYKNPHAVRWWSHRNYTKEEWSILKSNNVSVFNAGQFGFVPSKEMQRHFEALNAQIDQHGKRPHFYEQSHMNHYFCVRLLTVPTLDAFVGQEGEDYGQDSSVLFHYKDATLSKEEKFDMMQRKWRAVAKGTQPGVLATRFDVHTAIQNYPAFSKCGQSSLQLVEVGFSSATANFSSYLLERFAPNTVWLMKSTVDLSLDSHVFKPAAVSGSQFRRPRVRILPRNDPTTIGARNVHLVVLGSSKHTYGAVMGDLAFAFEILEPGNGWIVGLGFNCSEINDGAMKAVNKFCSKNGFRIWHNFKDACSSYVIRV